MRVIIVGNGLAGTIAAKTLRELDPDVEITIFAQERYAYYPRPNLIEFVAGKMPQERIFAFSENWHVRQKIDVVLGSPVKRVVPFSREVEVEGGRKEKYDMLLLAEGSSSFVPPLRGADRKGVFTLKTLDDAIVILEYLKTHGRAAVIGGGLLGLEIARAIKAKGADVEVVEVFDRLLPRQLDPLGSALLRSQIESQGIKVRLAVTTEEILGRDEVTGLKFKNGEEISAEMVIIAAGVRPSIVLSKEAGLETDRGLVVTDHLQTSDPWIFGAGDCVQHRGKLYGIIPASFDQARIAAYNMLGQDKIYEGTIPSNTLKVVGLYVTSIGLVNPESGDFEELRKEDQAKGIYKKIVLQDGILIGAIWMGTKAGVNEIGRAVALKKNIGSWKNSVLEDNFSFSLLL